MRYELKKITHTKIMYEILLNNEK